MNMKKNWIALGAALMLGLTGCGRQQAVNAEQAGMLATAASSSDKFAGMVVSENAVEITRDTDKQIEELYVAVGDTVKVVKLHGEGAVRRRIMDMGITKNVEIFIRKVAPLGDPIEINVRGYELSLRKADAEMIEIY